LDDRAQYLERAADFEDDEDVLTWQRSWIPLVAFDSERIFADCAGGDPPAIHRWTREQDDLDVVRARSWGDVLRLWIRLLEAGHRAYSPAAGRWLDNVADYPPESAGLR
jgi:hypothetical protein